MASSEKKIRKKRWMKQNLKRLAAIDWKKGSSEPWKSMRVLIVTAKTLTDL